MKFFFLSENTAIILFEQAINADIFQQVTQYTKAIEVDLSEYIVDLVPAYASIHIVFNLIKISAVDFEVALNKVIDNTGTEVANITAEKTNVIPVYYGPEVALDIELVATFSDLSVDAVIALHASVTYDVYAIGFAPGFAYLGNVDRRIAMPRKESPRQKVVKGSVGIADQQTAIYPADSPGGWQIIGRTPMSLIDYNDSKLTRFDTGDRVKFTAISRKDFIKMGGIL
jgi:KipI family sensor histidine kinase inhibitor